MKYPLPFPFIAACLAFVFSASSADAQLAQRGSLLLEEDFATGPFERKKWSPLRDTGWKVMTSFGDWTKTEAGIQSVHNSDHGHGPVLAFEPPEALSDAVLELEFRFLEKAGQKESVRIAVDNRDSIAKGHVCSAWANWTNDFVPTGVTLEHIRKEGVLPKPSKKAGQFRDTRVIIGNAPANYEAGKWYSLRLEIVGDRALAAVSNSVTVNGRLDRFATPKTRVSLTLGSSPHEIRAFRVRKATLNPKWTDAIVPPTPTSGTRPNIVLIMADDIGIEGFGSYGGTSYKTPRIDELAKTGLRFTHAYSQPLCTPTRIQLMTGRYNHRNWTYFGILDPKEKTFGHRMQEAGYKTFISGKWQLQSYDPPDFPNAERRRGTGMKLEDAGFDEWSQFHAWHTEDKGSRYPDPTMDNNGKIETFEGKYGEDIWVDKIGDFMERHRDGNKPMFIYYPMALPHWPFNPTPDSEAWNDPTRRLEEDTQFFPDMVAYMDKIVGRLVDHLDRLGLRDNTLVIFYGDNGTDRRIVSKMGEIEIPGGKALPGQSGIRVPLIANWPGRVAPGVCSDLVDASDFVPTLAELARIKTEAWWNLDGQSFAPQLFGSPHPSPRESVFVWYDPRPGWDKEAYGRSVFALDKKYKLFRDGRFFRIDPLRPIEIEITGEQNPARAKLQAVIDAQMQHGEPPLVDAFGDPMK